MPHRSLIEASFRDQDGRVWSIQRLENGRIVLGRKASIYEGLRPLAVDVRERNQCGDLMSCLPSSSFARWLNEDA
jgi:hypothetical protein